MTDQTEQPNVPGQDGGKGKFAKLMATRAGKIGLPIAIFVGGVFGFQVLVATAPKVEPKGPGEKVWSITAAKVDVKDIQPSIKVFGEVAARRTVDVRALVSGQIVDVDPSFKEGGEVDTGQLLVQIDPEPYQLTLKDRRAQLTEARARLDEAYANQVSTEITLAGQREQLTLRRRDYERAKQLYKKGNVSQKYLDDRRIAVSQQELSVAQTNAQLKISHARIVQSKSSIDRLEVAVALALRDLDNTEVRAPFAAVVGQINAELGKNISPQEPIARLTDARQLEARFTLSDQQYGRLLRAHGGVPQGAKVDIVWRVGGQDILLDGTIDRVGSRVASQLGGVEVFASISQDGTRTPVRPGAFVQLTLADRTYQNVTSLPADAVYEGDTVYVINNGRLEMRKVTVEANVGDNVLVSGNLRNDDQVLATFFANAGQGVAVKTTTILN